MKKMRRSTCWSRKKREGSVSAFPVILHAMCPGWVRLLLQPGLWPDGYGWLISSQFTSTSTGRARSAEMLMPT